MTDITFEPLGCLADVDSGPAFKSAMFGAPGEGVRLVRGDNIEPGALRWDRTKTWPESQIPGYEHLFLDDEDLILGMDRPVISSGLKLARVKSSDLPALLVQRVARIRPRKVPRDYLFHWLVAPAFANHLTGSATGTQLPHVTLKSIRDYPVPRFGEEAERRIVDLLEGHLSRLDAADAYLSQAVQHLHALRMSRLAALETPAAPTRALETVASSDPRAITDGPFGANLASRHYTDEGPRVVRLENIGDGEFIDESTHIDNEHFESLRKHEVKPNDLLVASLGTGRIRACLAPADLGPAIVKADCIRVRLGSEVDPRYVLHALGRPQLKAWAENLRHGVGRPRLGMAGVRALPVPLPPLAVQKAIADELDEAKHEAARLREALAAGLTRSAHLRRSLLSAAFSGRLTSDLSEAEATIAV